MSKSTIESVGSFLAQVKRITEQWDNVICSNNEICEEDKPTMKYFFRGHGNSSWKLRPSLFRPPPVIDEKLCDFEPDKYSYFRQEQFLIQEAIRLYPSSFSCAKTDIERMTICQHHALPTRLLDVSGNALVALYFAVSGEQNSDGVVYVFRASAEDYNIASTAGSLDEIKISRYHSGGKGPIAKRKHPILVFTPHETMSQTAQDGSF